METYQDVVLKKLRVAIMHTISAEALYGWRVDGHFEGIAEHMVARLASFVWAGEQSRIAVPVPAGWFQQWKLEKAPKWLLKRYPVKYTEKFVDVTPYFPKLRRIAEQHESELRFRVASSDFRLESPSEIA